jgi:hypothetical protein
LDFDTVLMVSARKSVRRNRRMVLNLGRQR